mmetsp:Transcript_18864/g.45303  ORF Transcript_18864/g.45303 Transcript_18864/m.45303 type:complete len:131 (+) Transcript_18864:612-1004(+)
MEVDGQSSPADGMVEIRKIYAREDQSKSRNPQKYTAQIWLAASGELAVGSERGTLVVVGEDREAKQVLNAEHSVKSIAPCSRGLLQDFLKDRLCSSKDLIKAGLKASNQIMSQLPYGAIWGCDDSLLIGW